MAEDERQPSVYNLVVDTYRTRERELRVLQSSAGRRLVAEFLLFGGGVALIFMFFVEPILLSRFPSLFPNPSSPQRVIGSARYLPTTRIGWVQGVAWSLICGPFLYVRLFHTELGESFIDDLLGTAE